jgi:acetyl-CoA carboxylase biotin carboxylase subunit
MFKKVLIANRGEIAIRIMRACRELGVQTVAVYSEADCDSLHVKLADEAYCIGAGPVKKSYLNIPNIISAAILSGVDAIHPGYGMLSENPRFAEICQSHGIKFIGPSFETLERVGDKAAAKQVVERAGVPVIPGSDGPVSDDSEACYLARTIGYPVMVKASSGGGGKGIRIAKDETELKRIMVLARSESETSFGNDEVYVEKFIERPRHVEIQIMADDYGNIIHLGERDCTLQRRHQKLIEESPSPAVDRELRAKLGEKAIVAAEAVGYTNLGTVEFLLDGEDNFYFIEMNARIQVEHPVTEMVTDLDLVKSQILLAAGERSQYLQDDIEWKGHAIECRINAEDPSRAFMPSPGRIELYRPPGGPGIRVDDYVYSGFVVTPYYDPMFAKVIAWGGDRTEAILRMRRALDEYIITGIDTNINFHRQVLNNELFLKGEIHTNSVAEFLSKA